MDLVRELKEVRFELSLRGYDCEAVDAFLAQIRGDLTTTQSENDAARGRISELERIVESGGGSAETEGTLRRTLLLAQRLADETEAEAKKAAEELAQSSTAEAEQLRASAKAESASMRVEGERELSNARDEATTIRETSAEEAARTRGEARVAAEQVLDDAERRGMERVAVLEQTAQEETAAMREPVRSEVTELEDVRARLLGDISALEKHLEQQRVRVRTAVEALRVGMSGSIDDLERVAEDDDLLATESAPATSEATSEDVPVAPDIEIVDRVAEAAPAAPTIDDIEEAVDARFHEDAEPEPVAEDPLEGLATERIPVVEVDDSPDEWVEAEPAEVLLAEEPPVDDGEVVVATEDEFAEAELVELDEEPSALFGTDLASDAEVTDVLADATVAAEERTVYEAPEEPAPDEEQSDEAPGFVDRFTELLDVLPIGRDE